MHHRCLTFPLIYLSHTPLTPPILSPKSMFAAAAAVQTVSIKSRDVFESTDTFKSLAPLQQKIKDVDAALKAPADGRMQTVD